MGSADQIAFSDRRISLHRKTFATMVSSASRPALSIPYPVFSAKNSSVTRASRNALRTLDWLARAESSIAVKTSFSRASLVSIKSRAFVLVVTRVFSMNLGNKLNLFDGDSVNESITMRSEAISFLRATYLEAVCGLTLFPAITKIDIASYICEEVCRYCGHAVPSASEKMMGSGLETAGSASVNTPLSKTSPPAISLCVKCSELDVAKSTITLVDCRLPIKIN